MPPRPWLRFYPSGVPANIDYPIVALQTFLTSSAKKFPNKIALNFQGKKITYKELDELSNRFANGLVSLGISKGSKVAIILPNSPQFVIAYYGILKAGAIVVACNPLYKERELEFQLNDSDSEAVVLMNNIIPPYNFFAEFEKCRPRLAKMKHVFVTSITDYLPPIKKQLAGPVRKIKTLRTEDTVGFTSFLSKQSSSDPGAESQINPKEDLAVLQYTGGTTGTSKGAMLTHYNLVTNAIVSSNWQQLQTEGARGLAVIPFFHIYGMTIALNFPLYAGQEIFLLPSFNVKEVLETLHKEKITLFPGVATMYVALLNYPGLAKYSIKSVKRCLSGAAPLPYEVQRKFNEVTGGNLVEGYGLTEASPVTHCNPFGNDSNVKSGSIGIPLPDTDAKIVDLENGTKDLPLGEVGELAVKGPQVMKGYWKRSDETKLVLGDDGWLRTGDVAKMDDEGYFYIVDRKKDMIDASGFKVWPREVEEILFTHPDVKEAAVVGVKDPYRGETVKAYIVLKDKNKNPGAEAIRAYCKEKIAAYKVPRIIEFKDELPKTLVGKVLRRKLREENQTSTS